MSIRSLCAVAVFAALILFNPSDASHVSLVGGLGQSIASPVTTVSASTLPQGELSAGLWTEYVQLSSKSDAELKVLAANGGGHTLDKAVIPFIGMGYGLTDDITIGGRVPYMRRGKIMDAQPGEIENLGTITGLGDISVFAQARVINQYWRPLEVALFVGLKIPTGQSDVTSESGHEIELEFQPGSGSWDALMGVAASSAVGQFAIDSNLLYTMTTKGVQDTELGDSFNYNASVSFPVWGHGTASLVSPRSLRRRGILLHVSEEHGADGSAGVLIHATVEINGEWRDGDTLADDGHDHTHRIASGSADGDPQAENLVYFSPGVRVLFGRRIGAALSYAVPISQDTHGAGQKITRRVIFGVAAGF